MKILYAFLPSNNYLFTAKIKLKKSIENSPIFRAKLAVYYVMLGA